MKIIFKKRTNPKVKGRLKKKLRIRKKINGTSERPRLCIFRSTKHIYASIVDDAVGKTVVSVSSLVINDKLSGVKMATKVGCEIARIAKEKNIEAVVFDRNGFIYHGRVKALADAARGAGLNF